MTLERDPAALAVQASHRVWLEAVDQIFGRGIEFFAGALVFIETSLLFAATLARYAFNAPLVWPQLMKRPRGTHKRTESERYAALATTSGAGLSGINPSLFCVIGCAAPQM